MGLTFLSPYRLMFLFMWCIAMMVLVSSNIRMLFSELYTSISSEHSEEDIDAPTITLQNVANNTTTNTASATLMLDRPTRTTAAAPILRDVISTCPRNAAVLLPQQPVDWSQYDTIYLFHSRKAGGSTLRWVMNSAAKKYNLTYIAKEGIVMLEEEMTKHNRTFFTTSFRDPNKRVVSSYFFEGLWADSTSRENRTIDKARTLDDYIDDVQGRPLRWKQWACVSDCFTKWFGTHNVVQNFIKGYSVETAMDRLKRFHVILRTELLQDDAYWAHMKYLLGLEDVQLLQQKRSGKNKPDNTTAFISPEAMKRLDDLNKKDYEIMDCLFEKTEKTTNETAGQQ